MQGAYLRQWTEITERQASLSLQKIFVFKRQTIQFQDTIEYRSGNCDVSYIIYLHRMILKVKFGCQTLFML